MYVFELKRTIYVCLRGSLLQITSHGQGTLHEVSDRVEKREAQHHHHVQPSATCFPLKEAGSDVSQDAVKHLSHDGVSELPSYSKGVWR